MERTEDLERFERLIKGAEREAVTSIMISREMGQSVLDHIKTLEAKVAKLSKIVDFEIGDVVREVGESEPTGEVIQVTEGPHEKGYLVKLYDPPRSGHFKAITYYENEIELIERKL